MPTMNPDGYSRSHEGDYEGVVGRPNAHNEDLNRNFPNRWNKQISLMLADRRFSSDAFRCILFSHIYLLIENFA